MKLRVKEILRDLEKNQKWLAEKVGVAEISLSRSINGNPSLETLEKIANALEVPISELFEKQGNNSVNCPNCGARLELKKE
jgi:transcriptional regulator with XRE-family HTH domain